MINNSEIAPIYILKLYITGASPNSIKAVTNITVICQKYLEGRYSLEIIDVYQQHAAAQSEQIVALPLLIRFAPSPMKRLIGNMSDTKKVLKGLEISEI